MSKSDSSINDKMREMQSKYSSSSTNTSKTTKKEANLMVQMNLLLVTIKRSSGLGDLLFQFYLDQLIWLMTLYFS